MIDDVANIALAYAAGASLTPERATTVLDVLPRCRAPSVLAAVLSRGFEEFSPDLAINYGYALVLLPHYPSYIIFDEIYDTFEAAGACGDMPTIELLWQLAGPTTQARMTWFEDYTHCFIDVAICHGHIQTLEWLSNAARTLRIPVKWTSRAWTRAIEAGHNNVVLWAIEHGLLKELHGSLALFSTQNDSLVWDWWITQQPDKEASIAGLKNSYFLIKLSTDGALKALDWWWTNTGSTLPEPGLFGKIADAALSSRFPTIVDWWWTRFLTQRTPEHIFGASNKIREVGSFNHESILNWYWERCQESRDRELGHFARSTEVGLLFTIRGQTTLPIMQWAVEKCALLGGQKLSLIQHFFYFCARDGRNDLLDLALHSTEVLKTEWSPDIAKFAARHTQLAVVEWCDHHQDLLPPQNLDGVLHLLQAVETDAVDVIRWWWLARRLWTDKDEWQQVCIKAITSNALRVQLWLRDHPDLFAPESDQERSQFVDKCLDKLNWMAPFTLDFIDTIIVSDHSTHLPLPKQAYSSQSMLFWWCSRSGTKIASLLPLEPSILDSLFDSRDMGIMAWWLHAHLAAGHRMIFPTADKLDAFYEFDEDWHHWMYDVTVTRGLSVFAQSNSGPVPYIVPPLPLSD
ncbi:hypothetical protein BC828DRAFT_394084 [Blastocladiella britannica]|nr:hypothetical protein BC828DRAFT_394084 [Blastocladiella britannica]